MKLSRLLAASGAFAVVAAMVLVSAAPASAEDGLTSVEYVSGVPLGGLGGPDDPVFAQPWTAYSESAADYASTFTGLEAESTVLVLRGTDSTSDVLSAAETAAISGTDGRSTLVIILSSGATDDPGIPVIGVVQPDGSLGWSLIDDDPGSPRALADILAELPAGLRVAYYGFAVDNPFAAPLPGRVTTAYLVWDGLTTMFTPQPVASVPTSITLTQARTGAAFSSTGFLPGESVEVYLSDANSGGPVGEIVADAAGVATFTLAISDLTVGTYTLALVGSLPNFQLFEFAVVADPIAIAPAQLAATGTDLSTGVIAGGFLLLAGAGFALVATRRRFGTQA